MRTFILFIICCSVVLLWPPSVFADLQITTSQEPLGSRFPATNLVVYKFHTNILRMDVGTAMSTIVLPEHGGQVQLFHASKTYHWAGNNTASETNFQAPLFVRAGTTNFNDTPARVFTWSTAAEHGRIWVVPAKLFWPNNPAGGKAINHSQVRGSYNAGSQYDGDSIVARSERITVEPVPLPGANGSILSASDFTNQTFTMVSQLISIVETNFSPSEFDLPRDYKETDVLPFQQVHVSPSFSVRQPLDRRAWEALRKQYETNGLDLKLPGR